MSEALSKEVAYFGIHVTLIEPGGYSTDWADDSAVRATQIPAYDKMREDVAKWRSGMKRGVPEATAETILKVVDDPNPPLRIFLGESPINMANEQYEKRIENWKKWQPLSAAAQGN